VHGSRRWLKDQGGCLIPEQVLLSAVPGQPPLSRWSAQIDSQLMCQRRASAATLQAYLVCIVSKPPDQNPARPSSPMGDRPVGAKS
jgi:hypothetical protein